MVYDGKTYRNLQDQVAYLTSKYKELEDLIAEVRAQIPSKMIVEELPEEGDPLITYYVGPKGTEPNLYYEVWVWVQEEPDGPFVWRELEDTDQVDLSGYLEKDETVTSYPMVYVKNADGTQTMVIATHAALTNFPFVRRSEGGQVNLMDQDVYIPGENQAIGKKYGDGHYVAKQTGATSQYQAYTKAPDGSQIMLTAAISALANAIAIRGANGNVFTASPTADDHAANKKYVDDNFLAKQTGSTSYSQVYTKNADGTQGMANIANGGTTPYTMVQRDGDGRVTCATPQSANDAANKGYVDAAVGQLLYLHDLEIIVTVDATNYLYVKAYLVNGSATAITSFGRILYKRIDVQWGAYGPDIANCEPCAVTKLPDTFRQDEFDDPFAGFLYQYISGGNLVSGKTDSSMSTTITDTVISF